ncbi:MAG: efflux transporter outer membrane subunit [Sphingobium sp.]
MTSSCRLSRSIMLLAGLGACAPSVHLPSPHTALPARYERTGAANAQIVRPAIDQWWQLFDDPQLVVLVETALARSTDARAAYFRISEARAIYAQSVATTLPTGNLNASATGQQNEILSGGANPLAQAGLAESYSASFSPSWEIDLLGRLAAVRSGAHFDYDAAAFDYQGSLMILAADVATGLFQARGTAVQLSDARETLRIAGELAATSRLGFSRGLVSGADAARLDSNVSNARAEVTRLDAALRALKRSLLVLTGQPGDATDSLVVDPVLAMPPPVPDITPADLLSRRPDVLAAQARLGSAAQTIQVGRLNLFPRLTLNASGAISRTTGLFGVDAGLWSIGAGVALPILDRPRLMAALRISEARGNQAVVAYERAVQAAFRDAENALTGTDASRVRMADLAAATDRARYAFDAARTGYRLGLTDLTTLLQSEQGWRATRATYTGAQAQALLDTVRAFRALGGGWSPTWPAAIPGPHPTPLARDTIR